MKRTIAQPKTTQKTLDALQYLRFLPEIVIRNRYLKLKDFEHGNAKIVLDAFFQHSCLTNDWQKAFLMDSKSLQNMYANTEANLYKPCAEASLARRAMAAILYQDFFISLQDSKPNLNPFQEEFNSFEEFWCAVEWDLMYRSMQSVGLINVTGEIIPQGKRKAMAQASQFFTYLDNPSKVQFNNSSVSSTASEALFFCAIYHAQNNKQFRHREFAGFKATLKRCHREIRNNKLQVGYLLEDKSLVLFNKSKTVLKPNS